MTRNVLIPAAVAALLLAAFFAFGDDWLAWLIARGVSGG